MLCFISAGNGCLPDNLWACSHEASDFGIFGELTVKISRRVVKGWDAYFSYRIFLIRWGIFSVLRLVDVTM